MWFRKFNFIVSSLSLWNRSRAEKIGRALVDTKMLQVVSSEDQQFRDDSNTILTPGQVKGCNLCDP